MKKAKRSSRANLGQRSIALNEMMDRDVIKDHQPNVAIEAP